MEFYVADAFAKECFWVTHQAHILNSAMLRKAAPQFLFADNKRQVADEDCGAEIFPRIYFGVAAWARNLTPLRNFTLIFFRATRVDP